MDSLPHGSRLDFEVDFSETDFVPISGIEQGPVGIQSAIVPVGYRCRDEIHLVGTAFSIVGWGLFVTAVHVVEAAWDLAPDGLHSTDDFDLLIFVLDRGDSYPVRAGGVAAVHADFNRSLDLALLQVPFPRKRDGTPLRFEHMNLSAICPGEGDDCFAFGYSEYEPRMLERSSTAEPELTFRFNSARGRVDQLHPAGRDRSMVVYPSFTTGARLDGGMSGGPVISATGEVIGVVSSSLPASEDDPQHTSTCCLIPPLLGFRALMVQSDGDTLRQETLFDIAQRGLLRVAGLDSVEVREEGDTRHVEFVTEMPPDVGVADDGS